MNFPYFPIILIDPELKFLAHLSTEEYPPAYLFSIGEFNTKKAYDNLKDLSQNNILLNTEGNRRTVSCMHLPFITVHATKFNPANAHANIGEILLGILDRKYCPPGTLSDRDIVRGAGELVRHARRITTYTSVPEVDQPKANRLYTIDVGDDPHYTYYVNYKEPKGDKPFPIDIEAIYKAYHKEAKIKPFSHWTNTNRIALGVLGLTHQKSHMVDVYAKHEVRSSEEGPVDYFVCVDNMDNYPIIAFDRDIPKWVDGLIYNMAIRFLKHNPIEPVEFLDYRITLKHDPTRPGISLKGAPFSYDVSHGEPTIPVFSFTIEEL